ncbi:MAG: hypothetical protein J5791_09610 [Fibrobacter sp.]|nr:hypothetical protein [Fibrobacter sp.]
MQYVISTIWFILSSLLIYNVFFYSDIGTFPYIVLCLLSSSPLAGCIIFSTFVKNNPDAQETSGKIFGIGGVGLVIGVVVSVVDYFFISKGFFDFLCDLLEIGFGYFAVLSYYLGLLWNRLFRLDEASLKQRDEERQQRNERLQSEIASRVLKHGTSCLTTPDEWKLYYEYVKKNGDPRKQKELEKQREIEAQKAYEFAKKVDFEERMMIDAINQSLKKIIDEGLQHKEYTIYGGEGFEETYFPFEYPISCLKTNNHLYARKVARMTEQEIDSEIINLEIAKSKKR